MSNATAAPAEERAYRSLSADEKNVMKITASISADVVNRKVAATQVAGQFGDRGDAMQCTIVEKAEI